MIIHSGEVRFIIKMPEWFISTNQPMILYSNTLKNKNQMIIPAAEVNLFNNT